MNNHNYKTPELVCVKTSNIFPIRFRDWIKESNHVYIGHNVSKYTGFKGDDNPWTIPSLEYKKFQGLISNEDYLNEYRAYYQKKKIPDIMDLSGMKIGCFCEDFKTCHGSVILELFKLELLERRCLNET